MSQQLRAIFDFNALEIALTRRGNMAAALRQLADEIDAGHLDLSLTQFSPHGFTDFRETRIHTRISFDMTAPVRRLMTVHDDLPAPEQP